LNWLKKKALLFLVFVMWWAHPFRVLTHAGVYTHAGPEIGVASTKAFTAQVSVLTLIAFYIAQQRGKITQSKMVEYLTELKRDPSTW
jgi:glucosamine 6-phosphate synthetase-like amidotransferase/phosphosugar isomerase protein